MKNDKTKTKKPKVIPILKNEHNIIARQNPKANILKYDDIT